MFDKKSLLKNETTNKAKTNSKTTPKIMIGTISPRKILMTENTAPIKVKNTSSIGLKFINLFTLIFCKIQFNFLDKENQFLLN